MNAAASKLLSQTRFADRCSVSRTAISTACKSPRLINAMVGKKIDIEHPLAVAYWEKHKQVEEVEEMIDINHPAAIAYLAKCRGISLKAARVIVAEYTPAD